jgi:hypothetical protein
MACLALQNASILKIDTLKAYKKNYGGRIMPSKRLIAEWGNSSALIVIRRWLEIVNDK